jgi:hypothetical protein
LTRAALIFASESYGLAIAVALLGIAAVSALSRDIVTAPQVRRIDALLGFVFLCALPSVIGMLKISVIMLLVAAAVWFFGRLRLYRSKIMAAAFIYALIFLYWDWLFIYTREYGRRAGIALFSELKALVGFTWWSYYWLFCYAWTLLFVSLRLWEEGARTLGEVWAAFRERRLLDVEFVLIIAMVGSVPEILLGDYSSVHYFTDDQHWLALGLTLAFVLRPAFFGRQKNLATPAAAHMTARGQFQAADKLARPDHRAPVLGVAPWPVRRRYLGTQYFGAFERRGGHLESLAGTVSVCDEPARRGLERQPIRSAANSRPPSGRC